MASKIIAFVQRKGGVGKTTVANLLALSLLNAGKKVAVIDFDTLNGTKAHVSTVDDPNYTEYEIGDVPDYIIMDTPGNFDKDATLIKGYIKSAYVIVLTSLDKNELAGMQETVDILRELGKTSQTMIGLNLVEPGSTEDRRSSGFLKGLAEINPDTKINPEYLKSRVGYKRAKDSPNGFKELDPRGKVELGYFLDEIIKFVDAE